MLTVMVVDDNDVFRNETCEFLIREGWRAIGINRGEEALALLENDPQAFDAIVLDRAMPGMTGDEVLQNLRWKSQNFVDACVVMVTGFDSSESVVAAWKLGAFEYLMKSSLSPDALDSILRAGVAWHRAHRMRSKLLRLFDRTKASDLVTNTLCEILPSARVHLKLVGGAPESMAEAGWLARFRDGERLIFEYGRPAVSVMDRKELTVGSMIVVPILGTGDQLRGILSIETGSEAAFSRSWINVLQYYADLVGIALELGSDLEKQQDFYREWRHKIATNLQIIGMQASQLRRLSLSCPAESSESIGERVRFIADNAAAIEAFAQDIKAFASEPGPPAARPLDAIEAARAAAAEQGPALKSAGITVNVEAAIGSTVLCADPDWLRYSLRCLIRNSIESILDARRERNTMSADTIVLTVGASESHVEIRVRDTGIGFDEEVRRQIFKPLFSTKAATLPETPAGESKGTDRVERILALMSRWVTQDPHNRDIPNLGRGMELFLRDGDVVEMFVGHQERACLDTTRLAQTASCRVALDSPLVPEWRGRGEGLYTVKKYMSRMGGYVSADSAGWDKGAEFRLSLPKSA
jgi:signal transduction histidine kinase/DNA-binding NarL/FixJ family response regulator